MASSDDPRAPSPRAETEPNASTDPAADAPAVDAHARPVGAGAGTGTLVLSALLAAACGLGGSYVFNRYLDRPRDVRATPVAGPPEAAADRTGTGPGRGTDTTEARIDAPILDSRDLADLVAELKNRVEKVQKQLDSLTRPTTPPEVASLQVRVADLTDTTNNLAPLPSRVDHLASRVSELGLTLATVRDELTALQPHLERTPRLASTAPTPRDVPEPPAVVIPPAPHDADRSKTDPAALARAAGLFHQGRYKQAADAFAALEQADPDDARVWYYAALSTGFAHNDWTEASVRLVERGVAREQAGTPPAREIDAAFRDLTSATGKDWLAAYRRRAIAKR